MAVQHLTMPQLSAKSIKLFQAKFSQTGPDDCWNWTAYRDEDGYGGIKIRQKSYRAHRIAYFLHYGSDPFPLEVCHRCDNPPCVNPAHLFAGTMNENVQDKRTKGRAAVGLKNGRYTHPERSARGERVNTARLTELQVREILVALKAGAGLTEIAKKHGVRKQSIGAIRDGKNWKHVPRP